MFESFGTADGPDGLAYEVVEKVDRSCYLMGHREGYSYGEDGVNHTIHEIPAETMKGSLVKPVKINSVWSDGEYVEDALLIGAAEGFDDVGFDDKLHYIGKTFGQDCYAIVYSHQHPAFFGLQDSTQPASLTKT